MNKEVLFTYFTLKVKYSDLDHPLFCREAKTIFIYYEICLA